MQAAESWFLTRGVVLFMSDLATLDWPRRAAEAGLTTIATHMLPSCVAEWLGTEPGEGFLCDCYGYGLAVEHELHARGELLPRALFERDPALFRMDERGVRTSNGNLCPSNPTALQLVRELAKHFTHLLPSSTGRYFYLLDVSRFARWDREKVAALDWRLDVLRADLALYAQLGIRHVTSFAAWLDGDYVARFGQPLLADYGAALLAAEG